MAGLLRELYNRALYYISVPKCISCGEILEYGERALCAKCSSTYREQKKRNCSRCAKLLPECSCSNFYLESHYIKRLAKVYRYVPSDLSLPGNLLIYNLKHANRRDTFAFLAEELASSILNVYDVRGNEQSFIVTNVPRRSVAVRRDGYDHSAVLAKRVASLLGIEYKQYLKSKAKKAQREMKGSARRKNAVFDYKRGATENLRGKTVILIDDVVTTGSSLGSCATLLRGMGTRKILGAAVSIAYKDSYVLPKDKRYD